MSLTKSEVIEKNRYELQISVDKATFDAAVSNVYRKQVKNITVPGFRKGKAPRSIIEKMYGSGVFYEDAIDELAPAAFEAGMAENTLRDYRYGKMWSEKGSNVRYVPHKLLHV